MSLCLESKRGFFVYLLFFCPSLTGVFLFVCLFYFIGVTLVNNILLDLVIQFYNIVPVYCIVCSPSQGKLLPSPFVPPLSSTTSPTPFSLCNHHTVVCVYEFSYCYLIPSPLAPKPQPLPLRELATCSLH